MRGSTVRLSEWEQRLVAAVDPLVAPSVAYGVQRGDEILCLGAAGRADENRDATTRTPYALASVTKPMTATAVAILAERGLVDLDAPIESYLGGARLDGFAGDPQAATVRRAADHTAGLPLHYQFYYADEPFERPPFPETIRRYGKLFSPPGARHQYSNLGYGLLDDLVARVSGVPYARFMAEEVFAPLGMAHAAIDAPEGAAVAYGPDGVAYPRYDTDHPGGSAAYASVEDLLAFGRFHRGGGPPVLSPETRRAMQVPTLGYGLGWGVSERHGLTIVQHTGGMGGVRTILRLVPELDLTIVVLVNGEGDLAFRAADDALVALDERFVAATPEAAPSEPAEGLDGVWHGTVSTQGDELPLALEIGNGATLARLDGRESFVEGLRLARGRLVGTFGGDVGTEDAARRPYRLHLDLGVGEALRGATVATTHVARPGGAPRHRLGNALSYATELRRD